MKHLLNNLTEEEKNSIRGQHTGGMNVVTENFSKLINTKSGDVKLFLKEDETATKTESRQINRILDDILSSFEFSEKGNDELIDLANFIMEKPEVVGIHLFDGVFCFIFVPWIYLITQ
jgi:hypothetical protein